MYEYQATVTKVYDGDTITVDLDLGFDHVIKNMTLRLYGINTPELRGGTNASKIDARKARDYLRELILDRDIMVRTIEDKTGKYGRYLAVIFLEGGVDNVNLHMIEQGYAEEYIGFEDLEHMRF